MTPDLMLIVRAAGERTESACLDLAEGQCGLTAHVIRERPFWRALDVSLQVGLEAGAQWTLMLDADVLLAPGGVATALASADRAQDDNFYMIQPMVLDRVFAGPTYAGVRVYRTSLFNHARRFIQEARDQIRPETYVCKCMENCGFPSLASSRIVGLHDYEQYYGDLYRKQFVRAYKFRSWWTYMFSRCRRDYRQDDFKVAFWGFLDGLLDGHDSQTPAPVLDALAYRARSDEVLELLGLPEKTPWPASVQARALAGDVLRAFRPDDLYAGMFRMPYTRMTDAAVPEVSGASSVSETDLDAVRRSPPLDGDAATRRGASSPDRAERHGCPE